MKLKMNVINLYQCDSGFETSRRVFDYHYMLYVHRGKGRYVIGNKTCPAIMGDLFYVPPGVGNTILADVEDPFLLSGIEFVLQDQSPENRMALAGLCHKTNILKNSFLEETLQQMVKEYHIGRMYSSQICSSLLGSLVMKLLQSQVMGGQEQDQMKGQILDYIVEHMQEGITHQELSAVFACHKSTINRILTASTGMSLKNYLIDLRLKKAGELLKYSNKSMSEIAELCGYQSSIFFSRQFKQKMGVTPLHFRNCSGNTPVGIITDTK